MNAYAESSKKYSVLLKWGAVPNAETYILQVLLRNNVISEKKVKGNEYSLELEPNRYSYRIRSEDRLGQQGVWSGSKDLIVRPPAPALNGAQLKEILDEVPKSEATLKWQSDDAEKFTVQIWDNQTKLHEQNVSEKEFKYTFAKSGNYSYSVASVVNQLTSEFSQRMNFQVKISELPFIKITAPKEASTTQGPDVTLRWTSTRPVHRYMIKIFRFDDQKGRYVHWADQWSDEKNAHLSLFGGKYTIQVIPYGKGENSRIRTLASGKFEVLPVPLKNTNYSAGLGITQLSYKETSVSNYSAIALTSKFGVTYRLSPKFDLGLSAYLTALTLSSNLSQYSIRFLGINARVGYSIPGLPPDWNLAIMFGGYYTTTFVTGNIGFQNLFGAQLTPRLLKRLSLANSAFTYAKFAPVTEGLALPSFSNRELALGVGWNHSYPSGRSLAVTLDVAQLALNFVTALGTAYVIESQSLTLGVGLNW